MPSPPTNTVNKNNKRPNGVAMTFAEKIEIQSIYNAEKERASGRRPNISDVAKLAGVSRSMVMKIEAEISQYGSAVDPSEIKRRRVEKQFGGPCSIALEPHDEHVLLALRLSEPTRTLVSYPSSLRELTGTDLSSSTVSRFFASGGLGLATKTNSEEEKAACQKWMSEIRTKIETEKDQNKKIAAEKELLQKKLTILEVSNNAMKETLDKTEKDRYEKAVVVRKQASKIERLEKTIGELQEKTKTSTMKAKAFKESLDKTEKDRHKKTGAVRRQASKIERLESTIQQLKQKIKAGKRGSQV